MKIFKTAVKAILVFDAAYLCFVCAEDVCSRIRSRMKKKNRKHLQPIFKVRLEAAPDDEALRDVIRKYKEAM